MPQKLLQRQIPGGSFPRRNDLNDLELEFSDLKNVPRSFKQIKGITPSEYRLQVIRAKF